jgi:hypothetical protein
MSSVTNVVILAQCVDEEHIDGLNRDFQDGAPFRNVAGMESTSAGTKYVEAIILLGGFNYLIRDKLFQAIEKQHWRGNVQVLIQGDDEKRFQEFVLSGSPSRKLGLNHLHRGSTAGEVISDAVKAERERCARIVEVVRADAIGYDNAVHDGYDMACDEIAEGIASSELPEA